MEKIVVDKLIVIFIMILLSLGLFIRNCEANQVFNIAIIQHQHYPDYQKAHDSFILTLMKLSDHTRLTDENNPFLFKIIEDINTDSDIDLLDKEIKRITNRTDIDLIFTIGTHSTKRTIRATKKIPIIFTMVSDPINAGIISDWESSYSNFTGVEMPEFFSDAITLLYNVKRFKKLGMIYLEGSPSHEAGIKQIKKLSKKLKFEFIYYGFPLRKNGKMRPNKDIRLEIEHALDFVCPKVDVFFVQSSNTFSKEFDIFRRAFLKYKLLSSGDSINIKKGLSIGINKDYRNFGQKCAIYAFEILKNKKSPKTLPMNIGKKITVDLNIRSFRELGLIPSFELISGSDNVYD